MDSTFRTNIETYCVRKPYKLHNCMNSITWYFTRATYNEHRKSKLEIKRQTMSNKYNEWHSERTRALEKPAP